VKQSLLQYLYAQLSLDKSLHLAFFGYIANLKALDDRADFAVKVKALLYLEINKELKLADDGVESL
jgi:hypothetical protein